MSDWLQHLSPGPLPIFAHTRALLIEQWRRADAVTAREVAQVVLTDPLACLGIIHAANLRGARLGSEITTAEGALLMLGMGRYLDQARNTPVLEEVLRDPAQVAALHRLLRIAYHAAWQARDFAVLHSDVRAEEVQVATLLHFMAEFLLLLRHPGVAMRLIRRQRHSPTAEVELLGTPWAQLRPAVLQAWNVADASVALLAPGMIDKARQAIIHASIGLARESQHGWWNEALLADYIALAEIVKLPLEVIIATAHTNSVRAERAGDWIAAPGAGTWMALLPGPWPAEPDDEEEAGQPRRAPSVASAPEQNNRPPRSEARPAAPRAPSSDDEATAHEICPMPDKQVLRETLANIEGHLDGSLNLNQMSAIILKGLHTGLGLSRILFAMMTPDGRQMKCRFTFGIPAEDALRHFAFEIPSRDLFGQLMGKMQGVWVNEGNREKLWPMVHPALQHMIGSGDFYAMSLHANGKPVGLVYADRGHGECGLDPHTYTDFKMLCLQAARGLGRLKTAAA